MIIIYKQTNNKIGFNTCTNTTVSFTTYKYVGLCPTWNENNSVSSTK